LTVTSINAGTSPVYQWFVSDTLYGTSQSIILSSLQNGTDVFIVMTADTSCLNENPINSDTLIFTVFNNPAPPVITLSNDTLNSSYGTGNQWYNNTGLIVGANNQLYVVAIDGDYYVIYTDTNGCYSISDTINVILTKIIKSGNPELVVFPNPADDKIFIYNKCLNNSNIIIEFYDITGQKVYSDVILNSEMTYYNTSSLLPGTYFIFFHSDGYNYHEKVIIY
jgi:hypothetical protein